MKTRGVITTRSITLDVLDLIKTPAALNPCAHEDDLMSKPSRSPKMMWDGYLVPPLPSSARLRLFETILRTKGSVAGIRDKNRS